jgi:hypothetical protein
MSRLVVPVATAVVVLSAALFAPARSAPSRQGEGAEAAVRSAELKRFEVMVKNDLAALEKALGDDLTYTHSSGVVDTKAQFLESLRSGRVRYQSIEPVGDLKVRVYGSTAVINGKAKVVVASGGQTKDLLLLFTDVWLKRAGRWQMVAWQSTKPP